MNESQPAKHFESFWRFLASLDADTFWWTTWCFVLALGCALTALSLGMMVAACQSEVARIAASRQATPLKAPSIQQHN